MSVSVHDPHVHVCQNTYVEVREQFLGIGSFPVLWDSEPELRPSGLQSKHLRSLSHPAYSSIVFLLWRASKTCQLKQ